MYRHKKSPHKRAKKEIAPYDAMKLRTTGFECLSPFVIHRAKHTIKAWPAIGEESPKEVALNVKTMYSKDGDRKPWAVVIQGQSIGSGIKNDFTIPYNKFSHHPFSKYDIIHIKKFHKSPKGYWYIDSYEVLI